jgi:hypothetical protein
MKAKLMKVLIIVLAAVLITAGAGLTYKTEWLDNVGWIDMAKHDIVPAGNELKIFRNPGGSTEFREDTIAYGGGMIKGEYLNMSLGPAPCNDGDPDLFYLYKFEEVEWGEPCNPANVYKHMTTETEDITETEIMRACGYGQEIKIVLSTNKIEEAKNLTIWPICEEFPGTVPPSKEKPPKPAPPKSKDP